MFFRRVRSFDFFYENVLGTSFRLEVRAPSEKIARTAEGAALTELDRLEAILSSFNPQSELSRWQSIPRGEETVLSEELYTVLTAAEHWYNWSQGAFHPGVESLTRLWKEAAQKGQSPSEEALRSVQKKLAEPLWKLEANTCRATLYTTCALSLNALAKGYIVERAAHSAAAISGVSGVLLEIGGDLRVLGDKTQPVFVVDPRSDAEGQPPLAELALQDAAVATSGGYRRNVRIGDRVISHLLDPRTGQPVVEAPLSVTVVGPDAMTADALATIGSVLPLEESLEKIGSLPGCGILALTQEGRLVRKGI